jgi:membrane-anchored glycerophosphoryl diester phosphodiesterase (GDPDase)
VLVIVVVSVFSGHILGPHTKDTPHSFLNIKIGFTLMFAWPVLLFISVFNNLTLSRALPEYTMKQSALDERQFRVRDSAYRRSYFVIHSVVLALFFFKLITLIFNIAPPSISLSEFTPLIMSISGLLNLVPISIIAWNERD